MILPLQAANADYPAIEHIDKFSEIVAAKPEFRQQEELLMWNMYHSITSLARDNSRFFSN